MSTILENLKLYFQNNSEEQIKLDWAESVKYDDVGPKIDDFIQQTIYHHKEENNENFWEFNPIDIIIKNPKFASDFFI